MTLTMNQYIACLDTMQFCLLTSKSTVTFYKMLHHLAAYNRQSRAQRTHTNMTKPTFESQLQKIIENVHDLMLQRPTPHV